MIGLLHVHSENSLKESAMLIDDICKKAKELGYEALALTDSYNMTGTVEFINTAKKYNLNPVPGVELFLSEKSEKQGSIILMAKDFAGYVGLCKAVSQAQHTKELCLELRDLEKLFGTGSPYHGHVIATSSGVEGLLCQITSSRLFKDVSTVAEEVCLQKELKEKKTSQKKLEAEILEMEEEIPRLEKLRSQVFVKKEEMLKRMGGSDYAYQLHQLNRQKNEAKDAEKRLNSIKAKISRRKKKIDELEIEISGLNKKITKDTSASFLIPMEEELFLTVMQYIHVFIRIFEDDFYLEFMFHGREEEAFYIPILERAARQTELSTVLSNDVHILDSTEDEILRWRLIRSLKDNVWQMDAFETGLYGMKSEEELKDSLYGFLDTDIIEKSFSHMHKLFASCHFEWPKEKHYPVYHSKDGRSVDELLEERVRSNIPRKYPSWNEEKEKRLQYELSVIRKTGYSDYTMILSEIIEEGRNQKELGMYIGPGRGSGAGSVVNYLAGITNIDPLKYGLIFERYLNIERISPPDIDSDIAPSIREDLIKFIEDTYSPSPDKVGVCSILTKSRYSAKSAVKAAGRVLSSKLYGNSASLYPVADRISKALPADLKLSENIEKLKVKFQDATEQDILTMAALIEGRMSAYGTHAAGIIISDTGDITDYAPVINVGSYEEPIWNIQYDMLESENIGLLKLDALALATLDINSNIVKRIYNTTGKTVDLDNIPFEKKVFKAIYGKGDTNGVFQCESPGMKRMWMELKPDCLADIIAGISLFRPGPMAFIPDYIKGKKKPSEIKYLTPELEPILSETYGIIIFQEQVMRIVRELAGYSMGRSDLVRRAMSKKKEAVMEEERKNFVYGNEAEGIPGCISKGISEEVANQIYDTMIDFAKYAFNKSHAAAYAVVSYQSAYLKYHYPKEFLIETMNLATPQKLPIYIDECKRKGYRVCCPDINRSITAFTEYDGNIIYGLGNVKGVKKNAESIVGRKYNSFVDYLIYGGANTAVTKMLIKSGAFDQFCPSRKGLLLVYESMIKQVERFKKLEKRLEEKKGKLLTAKTKKAKENYLLSIDKVKREIDEIRNALNHISLPKHIADSPEERLEMEKEALFCYVSVHPLDEYENMITGTIPLQTLTEPMKAVCFGVVKSVKTFKRKKNGKEMAAFELEDRTGNIHAICLPKYYSEFKEDLKNGRVLRISGNVFSSDDGELIFNVKKMDMGGLKRAQIIIETENMEQWNSKIYPELECNFGKYGHRIFLYDQSAGIIHVTDYYINSGYENVRHVMVRNYLPNIASSEKKE